MYDFKRKRAEKLMFFFTSKFGIPGGRNFSQEAGSTGMTDSRHCPQRPRFVLVKTVDSSVTCLTYELSHICRTHVVIRLTRPRPILWQRIYGALFDYAYQLNEFQNF